MSALQSKLDDIVHWAHKTVFWDDFDIEFVLGLPAPLADPSFISEDADPLTSIRDGIVIIHPVALNDRTPKFVAKYLVYVALVNDRKRRHSRKTAMMDRLLLHAPFREQVLDWLTEKGYSAGEPCE